jgi:glycerol-3-phosphate O-acyltransferase/dihydroxyacetone phosphate acyltransferase
VAYRILRWFLRLIARAFFRQIEVVGHDNVPEGAVLFAGNHPNSLLDPVLIITTCGRRVSFAAKDTLFKSRLLKLVLDGLGAVPIARRDDHGSGKPLDNDKAFEAMFEVLGRGEAIGIFPEGISHDESQLSTLKTGAARLALGAKARSSVPLHIVPCGLTFVHPARFRSRVLVQYGAPIEIDAAWVERAKADSRTAARELTGEIEKGMRALTINAPDWETVRALDAVRRLYQPLDIEIEDRVELARRFNTHYGDVKELPIVVEMMARVRRYQAELDALGVTDRELARGLAKREITQKIFVYFALVLFWLPLTLPGLPIHLPAVLFARFAGRHLTPRKDVVATTKVLSGVLLIMLAYGVVTGLVAWRFGAAWAIAVAALLPLSGYATLQVFDHFALFERGLGALTRRFRFRHDVAALRETRDTLKKDIADAVDAVKPADLVPLFPREQAEE